MCYVRKYVNFCIFIMFKSLPGLDLRRFVYPHTFSTNELQGLFLEEMVGSEIFFFFYWSFYI